MTILDGAATGLVITNQQSLYFGCSVRSVVVRLSVISYHISPRPTYGAARIARVSATAECCFKIFWISCHTHTPVRSSLEQSSVEHPQSRRSRRTFRQTASSACRVAVGRGRSRSSPTSEFGALITDRRRSSDQSGGGSSSSRVSPEPRAMSAKPWRRSAGHGFAARVPGRPFENETPVEETVPVLRVGVRRDRPVQRSDVQERRPKRRVHLRRWAPSEGDLSAVSSGPISPVVNLCFCFVFVPEMYKTYYSYSKGSEPFAR